MMETHVQRIHVMSPSDAHPHGSARLNAVTEPVRKEKPVHPVQRTAASARRSAETVLVMRRRIAPHVSKTAVHAQTLVETVSVRTLKAVGAVLKIAALVR